MRKIEETFNFTFDEYYVKRVEQSFIQKPIISETNEDYEIMNSYDVD